MSLKNCDHQCGDCLDCYEKEANNQIRMMEAEEDLKERLWDQQCQRTPTPIQMKAERERRERS